jgi:O-antigen/teichoic acid export membrane protein
MKALLSYAFGDILLKVISILLVPITTRLLSVNDYGIISLLLAVAGFLSIIQFFGMDSALPAFLANKGENEKAQVIKTAFIPFIVIVPILFLTWNIVLFKSKVLTSLFNSGVGILAIAGFYTFLLYPFFSGVLYTLRFLNAPKDYVRLNTYNTLMGKLGFIFSSILWQGGLFIYFICAIVATVITFIFSWLKHIHTYLKKATVDFKLLKSMLAYGIPLMPGGLIYAVMVYIDRFMLGGMRGAEAVGTYALALTMATTVNIAHGWFSLAWSPYLVELITYSPPERYNRRINAILAFVSSGLLSIAAVTTIFSVYIIKIFAAPSYKEASVIFPLLSIWASLNAAHIISNCGMIITKNSKFSFPVITTGLIVNIILNIVLIPVWGGKGAALAVLLGEFVIVLLWIIVTNYILKAVYVKISAFLPQLIVAFLVAVFFSFMANENEISFLVRCSLAPVIFGSIVLYGLFFIKRNDPQFISQLGAEAVKFQGKFLKQSNPSLVDKEELK